MDGKRGNTLLHKNAGMLHKYAKPVNSRTGVP
jgi:hypothetical protein